MSQGNLAIPHEASRVSIKDLLSRFGVPVPAGDVTTDPAQATQIAKRLGGKVVVKAQVLMGGRGKAGGVKLFDTAEPAGQFAKELIGSAGSIQTARSKLFGR